MDRLGQRIIEKNSSQGKSPSGSAHTHTFRNITRRERGFYGALHAAHTHTQPGGTGP